MLMMEGMKETAVLAVEEWFRVVDSCGIIIGGGYGIIIGGWLLLSFPPSSASRSFVILQ